MSIFFDETQRLFTMHTKHSTYQCMIGPFGFLMHLYYGKRVDDQNMAYLISGRDRGFSGNPYEAASNRSFSADTLPLEYSGTDSGDYRIASAGIVNADGSMALDLRYKSHAITGGKYSLEGLPALYEETGGEAETLALTLYDPVSRLEVTLLFGVFAEKDIITRAAVFTSRGSGGIRLTRAMSMSIDFPYGEFDLIHFPGRHTMERQFERVPVMQGIHTISSSRGTSSHQHNPGIILCSKNAAEDHGECYGFNLVYSGSFSANIETDQTGQTRLNMGLDYEGFCFYLREGDSFFTPETVMCFSDEGLAALSQRYHRIYRHNLCRGPCKLSPRPVLINNWEATYFDFDGPKLIAIAREASKLGIEMLVMDDGWFGARDSDTKALGDWFVNEDKLKMSLGELTGEINKLGLKIGLWFEPEMISEDSGLYREHPDWALRIPDRKPVLSRGQLALDMSREDVRTYIFNAICAVLDSAHIEYVKWDMNRSLAGWYSPLLPAGRQGELPHRYMLGLYELLEKLTQKYPYVLFEGCSGGGGRFDPGMLYYHPHIWCSDNTDALDRLKIQYGTSFFYPVSAAGSHVSTVPNHQTGRTAPLKTRCITALSGVFGFELDLTKLTGEEKEEVKFRTAEFKKYQPLIHGGRYYRLCSPFDPPGISAWQFAADDKSAALLCVVVPDTAANPPNIRIRLKGLDEKRLYRCGEKMYAGAALMYGGYILPGPSGDYPAFCVYVEALNPAPARPPHL
jgi:alpha-galactosidase